MHRTEEIVKLLSHVQTLVLLLGVPFWIISLGCVYLGWAIASRTIFPDFRIFLGFVITSVFITGSTFAYNDYTDRAVDRVNVRKKGSLLVGGVLEPRLVLELSVALAAMGLLFSLFINFVFTGLMGVCVVLSLLYSNPHVKLKGRGGWDLVINMFGIGVVLPLAGWSVARPPGQFPFFYLPSIFFGIGALYILSTLADHKIDRATGVNSFVVRLGKGTAIWLGFAFLVVDTICLVLIGYFNYLFTWSVMRLLWPPLIVGWLAYYHYIIRNRATYPNIIKTIIILAGIYIGDTGTSLLFFCGIVPVP